MFEEYWHSWGRAALLIIVAAALAALWFVGDLDESVFALVALGTALAALLTLMVVSCLINFTSLTLRAVTLFFAAAMVAGGLALVVDPLLPAPALVERTLAGEGDRLTWADGGRAGQAVLVRVQGAPGMRQDGKDKRLEIQLDVFRGSVFDVVSLELFREPRPTLEAAGRGGRGKGGSASSRTDAVREVVLPSPGSVTLVLAEIKPAVAAPLTVSIHPVRFPPAVRVGAVWSLFVLSIFLGIFAVRDGVRSFFPVAGAGAVAFFHVSADSLGPSAVLATLGGTLLVSAAIGAVAGLLINLVLDRLFGVRDLA